MNRFATAITVLALSLTTASRGGAVEAPGVAAPAPSPATSQASETWAAQVPEPRLCTPAPLFGAKPLDPVEPPLVCAPLGDRTPEQVALGEILVGRERTVVEGVTLDRARLLDVYSTNGFSPLWIDSPAGRIEGLREAFAGADRDGLNPARYHPKLIAARATAKDVRRRVELDLVLTDASLRFVSDFRNVDPALSRSASGREAELKALILTVARTEDPRGAFEDLVPSHSRYQALRSTLARYREAAKHGGDAEIQGAELQKRIDQIIVNMARWRQQASDLGDPHVIVNIPSYSLEVFREGKSVLTSPVVVGKPKTSTPVLSSEITQVIFNPPWFVPPSIQREMGLRPGITPVRKPPGPRNPLGRVKFYFPNGHGVYLHDTNAKGLMRNPVRAYSHGCVRVGNAVDLATELLRDSPQWGDQTQRRVLSTWRTQSFTPPRPIPVHLTYQTVWVDDAGEIHFTRDVYNRDASLRDRLRKQGALLTVKVEPATRVAQR